ncbi:uncharacterized protein [Temnothorax longispinosus]|uniref:uncharacterized protein isoform X3 n=1 Tax=Temnothorax longispinosus TaxID=300112 RepID=UPI003A9A3F4C
MLEQPQTTDGEESNTWILFLVRDGTMEARFNDEADLHNERQSFTEQVEEPIIPGEGVRDEAGPPLEGRMSRDKVFSWILRENLHKMQTFACTLHIPLRTKTTVKSRVPGVAAQPPFSSARFLAICWELGKS